MIAAVQAIRRIAAQSLVIAGQGVFLLSALFLDFALMLFDDLFDKSFVSQESLIYGGIDVFLFDRCSVVHEHRVLFPCSAFVLGKHSENKVCVNEL